MFELVWTAEATATFDDLCTQARAIEARRSHGKAKRSKQEGLFAQVEKAVTLLASNPRHPGLRTHEFNSLENPYDPAGKVFEAYAQNRTPGAYRVFWCYGPETWQITIIALTPHP